MNFPRLIHDLMIRHGWTEAQLAAKVGCNQSTINRIKRGQIPNYILGDSLVKLERKTA